MEKKRWKKHDVSSYMFKRVGITPFSFTERNCIIDDKT